ncbi:MAG TPA: hypothetical protein VMJ32_06955 [Pirellulales bacterium]|nr:hypothetical protein [Pirellulales bacterium]
MKTNFWDMSAFRRATACAALLVLASTRVIAADYNDTHWGAPVDGLKAGVRLDPIDRTEYHPGEVLNLVMEFDAELNHPFRVPMAALCEYATVHVVGPDGRECIWDPGGTDREDAGIKIEADEWEPYNDADEEPYTAPIRLAAGKQIWIDAKTDRTVPFSLIVPGTYHAWIECKIVAGKNPPKHAWQGTVKSGEVVWTMAELPVEQRHNEVTDEQQHELDAWLALAKLKNQELGKPLTAALTQEVLLAENEGLAQKLVEITKSGQADAMPILLARAGDINDGHAGIDGPYLKQLAEYILEIGEKSDNQKAETDKPRSSARFDPVMLYLRYHPDDADIHRRAVAVLSHLARSRSSPAGWTSFWAAVPYAWAGLQELGELKPGMTRQQAEDLLGPPDDLSTGFRFGNGIGGGGFGGGGNSPAAAQAKASAAANLAKNPDELQWTAAMLPGHENPTPAVLKAELKDGKTRAWKIHWPGEFRGKNPYDMPGGDPN